MFTDRDLLRVHAGSMTFDAFAIQAKADFAQLALKMVARYRRLPAFMDVDDVAQEMLMSVPHNLAFWRTGVDYSIKRFIVFRACAAGRKHIDRGLRQHEVEASYVTYELNVGAGPAGMHAEDSDLDGPQEAELESHRRVEERLRTLPKTKMQRDIMLALVETRSIDASVRKLIKDPRTKLMFAADDELVRLRVKRVAYLLADHAEEIKQAEGR